MTQSPDTTSQERPALHVVGSEPVASTGFVVDLDGFEGPVDLLLNLARQQKVDLATISVLALAEQYLDYIQKARDLKLEIAADYLVTAAWLTYLKSRLLLPPPHDDDEPSGEELAEALTERLQRLDAIRQAADILFTRPRLGHDRFPRGEPEGLRILKKSRYRLNLHDLLQAYLDQRVRGTKPDYRIAPPPVMRVEEAIERVLAQLGGTDWQNLLAFLPDDLVDDQFRRSAIAAHVGASLEMARDGLVDLQQAAPFGPIYVRRKKPDPNPHDDAGRIDEVARHEDSLQGEQENATEQEDVAMDMTLAKRIVEALLYAAEEPLDLHTIQAHLPGEIHARDVIEALISDYDQRGVRLERHGARYAIRTAPDIAPYLQRETVQSRRLSRAALETLAIIAYHQPITRAEIEDVRGVSTNKGTLDLLIETGWVKPKGRRETPGRPVTWVTTSDFLDHLDLGNLDDLPRIEELMQVGLLGTPGALRGEPAAEEDDEETDSETDADHVQEAASEGDRREA